MEFRHLKRTAGRMELLCELEPREQEDMMHALEKLKCAGVETQFADRTMRVVYKALSKSIRRAIQNGIRLAQLRLAKAQDNLAEAQAGAAEAPDDLVRSYCELEIGFCQEKIARCTRAAELRYAEREARRAAREALFAEEPFAAAQVVRELEEEPMPQRETADTQTAGGNPAPRVTAEPEKRTVTKEAAARADRTPPPAKAETPTAVQTMQKGAPSAPQTVPHKKKLSKKKRRELQEKEARLAALRAKEERRAAAMGR
ncbi:MAG: hypothetical protein LBR73_00545 [Oscillospiraceae bacterium]|jgi:hypothetical protein|nr:hypothetical protein [Oscillospiraceae bacterium]